MKARRSKASRRTVLAGGGIVIRHGPRTLIAVVQRRKDKSWVLPKGKLKRYENAVAAARREAVEETGEEVRVHEFLGAISYKAGGRPKVVEFWRMQSTGTETRELMADIRAVEWLPLEHAIARLTQPLERAFLGQVGRRAIRPAQIERRRRRKAAARRHVTATRRRQAARRSSMSRRGRTAATRSRRVAAARSKTARKTQPLRGARKTSKKPGPRTKLHPVRDNRSATQPILLPPPASAKTPVTEPNLLRRMLRRLRQDMGEQDTRRPT